MKSGFIAIVGRPNAGKSTLLNSIMNQKLAIISSKPQTTRNNIQGILSDEDSQMIFIDTPGIHKPHHELGRTLNKSAYASLQDVDVIYYMVDASVPFGHGEEFVLNQIKGKSENIFLILNKAELLSRDKVMQLILQWQKRYDFKEIFPLSALERRNVDELIKTTKKYLSEGPMYFDSDTICDHDQNFLISELIREKIIYRTQEEIPHSVAVVIENREETENKIYIQAMVIVERASQKGILIGKQGKMISSIRLDAQKELRFILGKRVELELYVRIEENWRNKESKIHQFGIGELDE
ncbi:GTPase Era [uncultured Traorella sp.]|uniref:GTPase Era n=1 Tax=uncultured Traorella sp. TaxID=1929048 RepID=UPI0025FA494D|nr:GTPase Era [uncultured Traorella sp.]